MKPSILLKVFSSAFLLFPVVADALEMPQPKLGLWEMRVRSSYDGAAPEGGVMPICLNAAAMERNRKAEETMKKDCTKSSYEVRKEGSKWMYNSVCKVGSSTVTGQMTREFNGENAYQDVGNSTYDPPMDGHSRLRVVLDYKWLGPCK